MTNIYGDTRECMQAVQNMMEAAMAQRGTPPIPGEVEFFPRAFLFGHYDSRGGAMITFDQPHALAAIRSYIVNCFGDDPDRGPAVDSAFEDFMGRFEVVVVGEPLPKIKEGDAPKPIFVGEPHGDLLYSHGYEAFKVFYRYKFPHMEDWSEHEMELPVIVFVKVFDGEDNGKWEQGDVQARVSAHFPNFKFTPYEESETNHNQFEGLEWESEPDPADLNRGQNRYRLEHWSIGEDACGCAVFHDYANRDKEE